MDLNISSMVVAAVMEVLDSRPRQPRLQLQRQQQDRPMLTSILMELVSPMHLVATLEGQTRTHRLSVLWALPRP